MISPDLALTSRHLPWQELPKLNLSRFVEEVAGSVAEAKLQLSLPQPQPPPGPYPYPCAPSPSL